MNPVRTAEKLREEAAHAVEAIGERHFTPDALERQIKTFAGYIYDLTDERALLERVAHAAWHLMDDSGELDTTDDNGVRDYMHTGHEHERLSDALDALEATGWDAHPESGSPELGK